MLSSSGFGCQPVEKTLAAANSFIQGYSNVVLLLNGHRQPEYIAGGQIMATTFLRGTLGVAEHRITAKKFDKYRNIAKKIGKYRNFIVSLYNWCIR